MRCAEKLQIFQVRHHRFVQVPAGRGEELLIHLASHGVDAVVIEMPEPCVDQVELKGDVATDTIQAILDEWEC